MVAQAKIALALWTNFAQARGILAQARKFRSS